MGNTVDGCLRCGCQYGSSPQAWGTRFSHYLCIRLSRFIPTGVGNTSNISRTASRAPVHPHRRGEHSTNIIATRSGQRFIPTGVGNTPAATASKHPHTVHPHRRGEHVDILSLSCLNGGSSPQAWGTRMEWQLSYQRHTVHPHRRGEHEREMSIPTLFDGSSPQAWGTPHKAGANEAKRRFIPTGVGNTRI